jgi:hypothetical protein
MLRRAVLLLFALSIPLSAGAAPVDPLWSKAVEASARAARWSPGEMRLAIEMADDAGKVLETWDNRYRLSLGTDGAVHTEVVNASHNGKDETRNEREAQAKREAQAARNKDARVDGGSAWAGFLDDPFDPTAQDSVEIRRLPGTREIAGMTCVAFAFLLSKPKNAAVEGTAWLNAATGLPVEFESIPRPLPRGAHELTTTVRCTDGLVSEVRVEGSGSLLFFKRRFVSVVTLGSWFRLPGG